MTPHIPMDIPAGVAVKVTQIVPRGQVFIMADYSHPETPMFDFTLGSRGIEATPAAIPDGRIIACHPDDEQAVRAALAVAQERPKWWQDWQRIEDILRRAARA